MTIAKTHILNIVDSRFTIMALVAGMVMLAASYVALVNNSVFNIVAREDALEEMTNLETDLAVLETRYIELSNQINLNLAYERGFVDASKQAVFVRASEASSGLSFAGDEI